MVCLGAAHAPPTHPPHTSKLVLCSWRCCCDHGAVPDPRLDELHRISASQKTVPTSVEFVDIAGLVKGASKGEGLGNQFLANIRECDSIVQVLAGWWGVDAGGCRHWRGGGVWRVQGAGAGGVQVQAGSRGAAGVAASLLPASVLLMAHGTNVAAARAAVGGAVLRPYQLSAMRPSSSVSCWSSA